MRGLYGVIFAPESLRRLGEGGGGGVPGHLVNSSKGEARGSCRTLWAGER